MRVANKLRRDLDGVDRALGEGRISFDHARVLTGAANPRVADAIAGVQDDLVRSAEGSPFGAWQRGVAELVELADQDGGHDPADDIWAATASTPIGWATRSRSAGSWSATPP